MPSASDVPRVRVAAVGYLNARPLVEGLDADPRFDVAFDVPSVVSARLKDGAADLGLAPIVEASRLRCEIVGDACVSAYGPVDSVLLFLKRRPRDVRVAALDVSSRTSRELARWYLRREGAAFDVVDARPAAALDDPAIDAVLAIGDDALVLARGGPPRVDLAEAWARAEGLPFVFAVWCARPGLAAERPWLAAALSVARDAGMRRIDDYAAAAAGAAGGAADLAVYLGKRLRYVLGAEERRGAARFLAAAGLPPLR